ncbi:Zinc finger swim domain-containing protein 1 [Plakobranchus ocellatus]|uniref:Zinc finger swim domain-containing protein 1 n=1 Tax=Plakobranchus ocellatus TaxID=259542 RepID=A0AAV4A909_9GAST|nr:Zinc finger swim domain-containing protein 1 [Plakobranchus ocellatus]
MAEISAIETVFPGTPVNLCSFHIHQAVRRFLRKELPSASVETVMDMFMSQVYTESEEEFHSYSFRISQIVPQVVKDYFNKNWWSKSVLWAACKNVNIIKLLATTTNHIESYHSKIKKTLNEKISLHKCLQELLSLDLDKFKEHNVHNIIAANSVLYDIRDKDATQKKITSTCSKFAASLLKVQLSCARKTAYKITNSESKYTVAYREKVHETTTELCSCSFFQHLRLQCRHIFALRGHLNLEPFDNNLVSERFKILSRCESSSVDINTSCPSSAVVVRPNPSLNTTEGRYKRAKNICDNLVNHLALVGAQEFKEKITHLEALLGYWTGSASGAVVIDAPSYSQDSVSIVGAVSISQSGPLNSNPSCDTVDHVVAVSPSLQEPISVGSVSISESGPLNPNPSSDTVDHVVAVSPSLQEPISVGSVSISESGPLNPNPSSDTVDHVVAVSPSLQEPISVGGAVSISESLPLNPCLASDTVHVAASSSSVTSAGSLALRDVKLARLAKAKGRPRNRQMFTASHKRKREGPVKYVNLPVEKQQLLLIRAVCGSNFTCSNSTIASVDIKHYTDFADTVLEPTIKLDIIQSYFDEVTWCNVLEGIENRRHDGIYKCGECREIDDFSQKMIMCEQCLVWFHFSCADCRSKMKVPTWFCSTCFETELNW